MCRRRPWVAYRQLPRQRPFYDTINNLLASMGITSSVVPGIALATAHLHHRHLKPGKKGNAERQHMPLASIGMTSRVVPGIALSTGRYRPRLRASGSNCRLPMLAMSLHGRQARQAQHKDGLQNFGGGGRSWPDPNLAGRAGHVPARCLGAAAAVRPGSFKRRAGRVGPPAAHAAKHQSLCTTYNSVRT